MYTTYFGFTETPFSMTPDPRYLYMSERHRDALAHLLYGVGEDGGFVQLTGEVGTGKTTLCRCLLEQLPPNVDVALILNPRLTPIELLAAVCDELRISYPAGTTSGKPFVDALYRHLLDAHAQGRRTVLIVDEAQDLAADVLEQIRLLTNLETPTRKLLQIILIGQPELIRLLNREELRQLAQRVTARYHLLAFSEDDVRAYIVHRLQIAGQKQTIFTDAAMRAVHVSARGIPRLINAICDRALLGAYTQDQRRVTAATVRRAASEVLGETLAPRLARRWQWVGAAVLVAVLVTGSWAFFTQERAQLIQRAVGPSAMNSISRSGTLSALLSDPSLRADRKSAFAGLYATWRLDVDGSMDNLGCERGRSEGLQCLFKTGTWGKLRRLNLPAIIELSTPAGDRRYATVVALDEQNATLDFGGRRHVFPLSEIDRYWDGPFILLWKVPELGSVPIRPGARGKDVEWVRERFAEFDGVPGGERNRQVFDNDLRARVIAFQRSRLLTADGVVGKETLTHLSAAQRDPKVPRLRREGS
ncbi:Putative general secretion pathway protein A [Candidatus Methylomirabilis lanthanidiphila]|uniref:General secretion pathway protein A n=1 Tax=Candidatus Methylomirabilis lanthanidiphila TaxID=2211376 RepID=A0A564ZJI1_9BACT|nr:Putative general secretion pathway protein A [Candidatus Methylomirabilis lanthanidiphila]